MCGGAVVQSIMRHQRSERLWLPMRSQVESYIAALARHAASSMDSFPPGAEAVVNGVRSVRRNDGSISGILAYPLVVGPEYNKSRTPVRMVVPWMNTPQGNDSHSISFGCSYSAGRDGEFRLRGWLDFVQRDADDQID